MNEKYELEIDSLAVNLTKPARQFGVPLVAFYTNCMVCFLLGILSVAVLRGGLLIIISIFILFSVIHITMIIVTFRDAFGMQILWVNFTKFRNHPNFKMWGNTDSFSP